ncbi:hypothetical protein FNV43_RR01005 [Rhamnella rubrinervis]|uniref:Protein TAPETUM DETERMINANT 1-like n=1 Tax=Rhamnella rubrinervis TaxID=2594499 RepID=A0A8K0HPQ2_9ROSA|nr:hypothetical protein FNV43_RR01005 [Rhamnella rubrinervis]
MSIQNCYTLCTIQFPLDLKIHHELFSFVLPQLSDPYDYTLQSNWNTFWSSKQAFAFIPWRKQSVSKNGIKRDTLKTQKAFGSCTSRDISISQSRDSTSGIPQYIVQIVNTCVHGCAPSNIHLHCGWFASARMVNRMTFKRLSYDDCLVNEGKPLKSSQIISFTYSNSFMYPLALKTAKFC